mgnify:FL=1
MITATDRTAVALAAQYTEPTGAHILDSGGAYGRNWERNQGLSAADFLSVREVTVTDWGITTSAFHLITRHLEFTRTAESLTKQFRAYVEATPKGEAYFNSSWTVEAWLETIGATGPEGTAEPLSNNTYNFETLIDSVFEYCEFTWHDERYVALSYHGGCDVRGGNTDFTIYRGCECWLYAMTECTFQCANCERCWSVQGMEVIDCESGGHSELDFEKGCPDCGSTEFTGDLSECWGY